MFRSEWEVGGLSEFLQEKLIAKAKRIRNSQKVRGWGGQDLGRPWPKNGAYFYNSI